MANDILKAILTRKPQGHLHHYTTQAGFIGIVESEELWATHTQYLNDQQEYLHAITLITNVIVKRRGESTDDLEKTILAEMIEGIDGMEAMNVCVASFSAVRDSLSQWRAYSRGGSGYSITFDGAFLSQIARSCGFNLVPCLYGIREKLDLAEALVDDSLAKNISIRNANMLDEYPRGGVLPATLNAYAPILKNSAFSEEQEWRLITSPLSCRNSQFSFRQGSSTIIPYYRIPLKSDTGKFVVEEIVVGPCSDPPRALRSATSFVVSKGYKKFTLSLSNVPIRSA